MCGVTRVLECTAPPVEAVQALVSQFGFKTVVTPTVSSSDTLESNRKQAHDF